MHDPRLDRLAHMLLNHSLRLAAGNIILINAIIPAKPLVKALLREAKKQNLYPVINWIDDEIARLEYELLDPVNPATHDFLDRRNDWNTVRIADVKAVLNIRGSENDQELGGVPANRLQMVSKAAETVSQMIINERQWVLFYWPTPAQAQKAGLSTESYTDFVLDVSLVDYEKLYIAEQALAKRMEAASRVHIISPGTDLTFSIEGLPAVCCYGRRNVPDGEVYTAPIRDSVNGKITYNVPSNYWGKTFHEICLSFVEGRIVEATCSGDVIALNRIFDTDDGARYIGEFSFGVNPLIRESIGSTLFDEKITGSLHFTPGNAYAKADNGNRSTIHWDLILIQRPEHGGGAVWFDDELIRKDGLFIPQDLQNLNP
ncbi:MAG: aminopeptidase [Eubacteriales bacterium]|nr:aminopeptidase [Eubacteriales bacterium]